MQPIPINTDLLSGALIHLARALGDDGRRSSAIAALLFNCLGEDTGLGEPLRGACGSLAETLENLRASRGQKT